MAGHKLEIRPEELVGPMGMSLRAGRLVATVKSKATGKHITIRLTAKRPPSGDRRRWEMVPFGQATHVFADVPRGGDLLQGDSPGTFKPEQGTFWPSRDADPARVWAAMFVLRAASGRSTSDQAEVEQSVRCFHCGRELTDPESIQRGIGPVCYGKITASEHQRRGTELAGERGGDSVEQTAAHDETEQAVAKEVSSLAGTVLDPNRSARELIR